MFEDSLAAFQQITQLEIFAFLIPFIVAIAIDLNTHRDNKPVTMLNAAVWSVIWFLCAVAFGFFVFQQRGAEAASLYATGYLLEKALAVDNLFAFYLIFKSFGLTKPQTSGYQHRILYWGILGAIFFRIIFLGVGAFLANLSPLVLILFALIVLWTVWKMWTSGHGQDDTDYSNHWSVSFFKRFGRTNPSIASGRFFDHGMTPLFLCLICIEMCDVVFAFDSMPVIIAVVKDPYLMITSSLWAAAGLRSLYFLLVAAQNLFWALDKAIMILLVYVSFKLMGGAFGYHLPNKISLSIVGIILASGIIYSLVVKNPNETNLKAPPTPPAA